MQIDKKAHAFAGAAIAATVALYTGSAHAGLLAGIVAGALKELWDRAGHGTPDLKDFLATAAGATVVIPAMM